MVSLQRQQLLKFKKSLSSMRRVVFDKIRRLLFRHTINVAHLYTYIMQYSVDIYKI